MAASLQKVFTVKEFREFAERPENADRMFELIKGEIIEVSPSRTYNSGFPMITAFFVRLFCLQHNLPCYISGADGTYIIQGNAVASDFAYKTTPLSNEYPDPDPPLWAIEVISPTDKPLEIRDKRQIYLDAGILYWEIYPDSRVIDVYVPGQPVRTVSMDGILDSGEVIPGFTLPVKDLFEA